jgi:Tfp pilus assembly protein FimT
VVLVTAIIAAASAVVMPSLESMQGPYRRDAAVDMVRASWANARSKAVEQGRPYRFAVKPGEGKFRLAPEDDSSSDSSNNQDARPVGPIDDTLPTGVVFGQHSSAPADPNATTTPANNNSSQVGQVGADGWLTVAVFLPDGTARDDAEIQFEIKGVKPTAVHLRGLTGAVTVKPVAGGGGR